MSSSYLLQNINKHNVWLYAMAWTIFRIRKLKIGHQMSIFVREQLQQPFFSRLSHPHIQASPAASTTGQPDITDEGSHCIFILGSHRSLYFGYFHSLNSSWHTNEELKMSWSWLHKSCCACALDKNYIQNFCIPAFSCLSLSVLDETGSGCTLLML